MKITLAEFVKSATRPSEYPPAEYPEIAFAGRSNVGKSSLINTLVNRKRLVKTSSTPGRTQLLNFFIINGRIMFVDLPGYGYAKVPIRVRNTWGAMIDTYILGRPTLKSVVLILDIRRDPSDKDLDLMAWLRHNRIPFLPVLTKADKLSVTKQKNRVRAIEQALPDTAGSMICFSAKTRQGMDKLWQAIAVAADEGMIAPKSLAETSPETDNRTAPPLRWPSSGDSSPSGDEGGAPS
jgi:GTP-binding protein